MEFAIPSWDSLVEKATLLIDRPIDRPSERASERATVCPTDRPPDRPTDQPTVRPTDRQTDRWFLGTRRGVAMEFAVPLWVFRWKKRCC